MSRWWKFHCASLHSTLSVPSLHVLFLLLPSCHEYCPFLPPSLTASLVSHIPWFGVSDASFNSQLWLHCGHTKVEETVGDFERSFHQSKYCESVWKHCVQMFKCVRACMRVCVLQWKLHRMVLGLFPLFKHFFKFIMRVTAVAWQPYCPESHLPWYL